MYKWGSARLPDPHPSAPVKKNFFLEMYKWGSARLPDPHPSAPVKKKSL
jgi:hypothetical protein